MEFIALVLLPLAVLMVAYALLVFVWRNSQIAQRQASYIDDRRGPLLLCGAVVSALGAIFIVSFFDFLEAMHHAHPVSGSGLLPGGPRHLQFRALANGSGGCHGDAARRRGSCSRCGAASVPWVQDPAASPPPALAPGPQPGGMLLQAGSAVLPGVHSSVSSSF